MVAWKHKIELRDLLTDHSDPDTVKATMQSFLERLKDLPEKINNKFEQDALRDHLEELEFELKAENYSCDDFNDWLEVLWDMFDSMKVWVEFE